MKQSSEDDIAFAGEFLLGLLSPADEAIAASKIATDTDFAAEVEAWNIRLQPLLGNTEDQPSPQLWSNISAALPSGSAQDRGNGPLRFWQGLTALSATAAAVLAVIAFQPAPEIPPPTPPAPLVAALGSETGPSSITVRYDAQNGQMLLTPVSLKTGKLYPELWVVPADGKARSLGMLRGDVPSVISVTTEMRQYMDAGATLAITPEPQGGAPNGKATGPIIASGKIITI
jgi:anti-sigma-K factor RskA